MFNKILFPVDLEDMDKITPHLKAVERLIQQSSAELRLITVLPGYSMPIISSYMPKGVVEKAMETAAQQLKDFVDKQLDDDITLTLTVREGRPHEQIVAEAQNWGADLIALPSQVKQSLSADLVGSVAQRVTERAKCSVLVLRPDARQMSTP